jgi:sortase B
MKKGTYYLILTLLLVVFGASAFFVGSYFLEGRKQAQQFGELSDLVNEAQNAAKETTEPAASTEASDPTGAQTEPTGETDPAETTVATEPQMLPGYKELYERNPDTIGWLKILNSVVDYPVMQTPNAKDYYLQRDFNKEDSKRGCLYVREECDVFAPSDNVTIYGHTMADGSMFAYLHEYIDKEVWDQNSLIFFDTLYEYHTYKIFAVFKTTATLGEGFTYHRMEWAKDEAEFDQFIATCKDLAFYETGVTPEYGDKIICLSTCEYSQDNGRLVVAAVRIS